MTRITRKRSLQNCSSRKKAIRTRPSRDACNKSRLGKNCNGLDHVAAGIAFQTLQQRPTNIHTYYSNPKKNKTFKNQVT